MSSSENTASGAKGAATQQHSVWNDAAQKYALVMHDYTAQAASKLIERVESLLPFDSDSNAGAPRAIDVGCGSGSAALNLAKRYPKLPILATDVSPQMLKIISATVASQEIPNVRVENADAKELSGLGSDGADGTYSHAISTFVLQMIPKGGGSKALSEIHRVLAPGGAIALANWEKIDAVALMAQAKSELDPDGVSANPFGNSPDKWPVDEEGTRKKLEEAGFKDVHVETMHCRMNLTKEEILEYSFEGGNPGAEVMLKPWRESGRIDELRKKFDQILDGWDDVKSFGGDAILVVARKE